MPKIINIFSDIAFSHMAISKGFLGIPGIVTWHKISEHMCPNYTPCNSSTVNLRLVPSLSSILQPGFHKLRLSGFVSHTSKLKVSVSRVHKFLTLSLSCLPRKTSGGGNLTASGIRL